MAHDVVIERTGKTAKVRNPWLVLLFTLLTVGIYSAFWWYFVNRELADLGRARQTDRLGDSPAKSVVAYTLGGLIYIPWIWTVFTTNTRVQVAQRLTVGKSHNGWVAGLLWVFTLTLGGMVYLQHELNKVWRAPGMQPVGEFESAAGDQARREKLEELRAAGALTEREFEEQRVRLGLP
jgi:signal transduction histidine kinase